MQLNTLNRVIALFLIGGFVVVLAAFALQDQILDFICEYQATGLGAPAAGVFLAVALLSITALAGMVVDALGNVTIRRVIKSLSERRSRASLFRCAEEFEEYHQWRKTLRISLDAHPRYDAVARDEMIKAVSAGMFFRTDDVRAGQLSVRLPTVLRNAFLFLNDAQGAP